jgi:hypothetical protein
MSTRVNSTLWPPMISLFSMLEMGLGERTYTTQVKKSTVPTMCR